MSALEAIDRNRELARACLAGSEDAFSEIYDSHRVGVYNLSLRITRNAVDAADVTQETFCAFLSRLQHLDTDKLIVSSYLYATARYRSIIVVNKRRRISLHDDLPGQEIEETELELHPERSALQEVQNSEVISASNRLPERQRIALAMRELEELSYGEIGEALGLKENAVAQLISRARLRLTQELRTGALVFPADDADCERAVPLILLSIDGKVKNDEAKWLKKHLGSCDNCQANLEAIEDACASYRILIPVPAMLGFARIAKASAEIIAGYTGKATVVTTLKTAVAGLAVGGAVVTSAIVIGVALTGGSSGDKEKQGLQVRSHARVASALHTVTSSKPERDMPEKTKHSSSQVEVDTQESVNAQDSSPSDIVEKAQSNGPSSSSDSKSSGQSTGSKSTPSGASWKGGSDEDTEGSPPSGTEGDSSNGTPASSPPANPESGTDSTDDGCVWVSETACE